MKKELLNELDTMKYLFGYKAGKVISEQTKISNDNSKELVMILLNAIQNNQTYLSTNLIPGAIIENPRMNFEPNTGSGFITFDEYFPSEKPSISKSYVINFDAPKEVKSDLDIFKNKENIGFYPLKLSVEATKLKSPRDLAETAYVVGAENDPKKFYDFLTQLDPKLIEILKNDISKHLSYATMERIIPDKDSLRNFSKIIFPQQVKK